MTKKDLKKLIQEYKTLQAPTPIEAMTPHLISGNYLQLVAMSVDRARNFPESNERWLLDKEPKDFEKALCVLSYRQVFK